MRTTRTGAGISGLWLLDGMREDGTLTTIDSEPEHQRAAKEAFRTAEGDTQLVNVMFVMVCAVIGAWTLRRYLFLLMRAEMAANQASCPDCGDYGRFRVLGHRPRLQAIDVCCRKCARDWTISAGQ